MKMNQDIKAKIKEAGLKQWQVAYKCGVVESTFIRWLRFPLSEDRRAFILSAIDACAMEEGQ